MTTSRKFDRWAAWVLTRRFGSDPNERLRLDSILRPIREQILSNASIQPGDTVIDVGTGDGFLGFGAVDRVGISGKVVFSDVSDRLLEHCKHKAESLNITSQCEYINASADDLTPIQGSSADVVMSKSVLMYVQDKRAVFSEYFRVLREMGRFSCFEPVNRSRRRRPTGFLGYDPGPHAELCERVLELFGDAGTKNVGAMHNWDERDLFDDARAAGFREVHLQLRTDCMPSPRPKSWDHFLDECSNPTVPTVREASKLALNPDEQELLSSYLRPLVEHGIGFPVESSFVFFFGRKV